MNYIVKRKNGLFEVDDDGNPSYFCELLSIKKRFRDINTNKEYIQLQMAKDGLKFELSMYCRSILADNFIKEFAGYGLSLSNTSYNRHLLSEYLMQITNEAELSLMHSMLGFCNIREKLYYLADTTYPETGSVYSEEKSGVSRKGTFESWLSGLEKHIKDNSALQLALSVGTVAIVNAFMNHLFGSFPETLLFAFIGQSSTGKTTALKLAASVFGVPQTNEGLIRSALDTDNYLYRKLSSRNGFPHFIDDTSVKPKKDFTEMIYQASCGSDKGRLTHDGIPNQCGGGNSTIMFTGENSIFSQTNCNKGLYARLVEFECEWTKDAESANAILAHISQNYGNAWKPFVKRLMSMSKEKVKKKFDDNSDQIKTDLSQVSNNLADRLTAKLALVMLSAYILQHVCNLRFDMEAIQYLLIQAARKNMEVNPVQDAFEVVKEFVAANRSKDTSIHINSKQGYVWILASHFKEVFMSMTGKDFGAMASQFVSNNYMRKFSGGYTSKHKMNGIEVKCYCFLITVEDVPLTNSTLERKVFSTGGLNDEN
ncbi:MAG: DUF927 domain-containing protein [Clostridiales bacterium]|nr:DUF927 domain-containing protein [Clostridiales bacterium]